MDKPTNQATLVAWKGFLQKLNIELPGGPFNKSPPLMAIGGKEKFITREDTSLLLDCAKRIGIRNLFSILDSFKSANSFIDDFFCFAYLFSGFVFFPTSIFLIFFLAEPFDNCWFTDINFFCDLIFTFTFFKKTMCLFKFFFACSCFIKLGL